jgi:hypothetical protein
MDLDTLDSRVAELNLVRTRAPSPPPSGLMRARVFGAGVARRRYVRTDNLGIMALAVAHFLVLAVGICLIVVFSNPEWRNDVFYAVHVAFGGT